MVREQIKVTDIRIEDGSTIIYNFEVPKSLRSFFVETTFFVKYEEDIKDIPKSILVIPFLSNILPIAWFSSVDVYIDEVDEDFFNTLPLLKDAFENMYPRLDLSGDLIFDRLVKNKLVHSGKTAQLFSGGLDSLATFIRRKDESPFLVTIWGADVKLKEIEAWEKVKKYNKQLAKDLKTKNLFIKSNFREFINEIKLNNKFSRLINDYGWWPGVQHGFGLAGLSSVIAYKNSILTFYIPSSYTKDFNHPWGSDPTIDNNIKWANTKVFHESYDLSRQEKTNLISNYIKNENSNLQIRVCWQSGDNGGNCSNCEKCLRTITGLLLEGIDPNKNGFKVDEKFISHVKNNITKNHWTFAEDEVFMWQDIQKNIPLKLGNIEEKYFELFSWIDSYTFKKYKPTLVQKYKKKVARSLPNSLKKNIKILLKKIII